jgi:hypothetical protein
MYEANTYNSCWLYPAMKPPLDWGVKTDASKIDEYIYTED